MVISAVISAYNEEKNIKDCLESLKGVAQEIVVVDNSSTDNTRKIASKYTDKIYSQKNDPHNIDEQKNFGFTKATGDFILTIDADERVTSDLAAEIGRLEDGEIDGYWISRKNFIFGKWIKSDMWWPDYQLKLFRKGHASFQKNNVHKAIEVKGQTERLDNPMVHINYTTISQFILKLNNYTDIEAESILHDNSYKFNWIDAIRFPVNDFLKTFFLQKGYKEGLHGLVLSILQAFYMEVVFAKLWEARKFEDNVDKDQFSKAIKKELVHTKNKFRYWIVTVLINETNSPLKKLFLKTARKVVSKKIT